MNTFLDKIKQRFLLTLLIPLLTISLSAQTGEAITLPFSNNQYITQWMLLGSFPFKENLNLDHDFLNEHGGESAIQPTLGMTHSGGATGEIAWKRADGNKEGGMLDLVANLTPNDRHICYAAVYIDCPESFPAIMKIGSNDGIKVFLNGKMVHAFVQGRGGEPDSDQVPITFKKGRNTLLCKVVNEGGAWKLWARFEQILSVDNAIYSLSPVLSQSPKRTKDGRTADLYSILLVNTANKQSVSEVNITVKNGKNGKEQQVTHRPLRPFEQVWMQIEDPIPSPTTSNKIESVVTVSTAGGKREMKVSGTRNPVIEGTTYFVQGFHVDPVWRDSQAGYQDLSFSNLEQHLYGVDNDPDFHLFLHEITYLKPYYDIYPQHREKIRKYIQQNRIETGGSYNQPNETSISGEAFVRNIMYGRWFHENVLKDDPKVYTPWDVFGHIIQLPQILAKSEFIGTTWERGNYRSEAVVVPGISDLYVAMSPDGTRLPTKKLDYCYPNFPQTVSYQELDSKMRSMLAAQMKVQQIQVPGLKYDFRLNANDEKAPTATFIGHSKEMKSYLPEVSFRADGAELYFKNVEQQVKNNEITLPVASRDESQYNEGCELSRFDLKSGNRAGENSIIAAEKFATIANLLGNPYPAANLDKAWRQLLYGQHHDGITGCGADQPYIDLTGAYHEALEISVNTLESSLTNITKEIKTDAKQGAPLVVFNSLNWDRSDVVRHLVRLPAGAEGFKIVDESGNEQPFAIERTKHENGKTTSAYISFVAKDIPSLGYRTYWVVPATSLPALADSKRLAEKSIENSRFKIVVDEKMGGGISSLTDKQSGFDYISTANGHPGNELILLKQGDGFEPAWRFLTNGKKLFSKDRACEIEVFETNVFKRIRITGEMERMKKRIQEITLYNELERIDFSTYLVDYKGLEGHNITEGDKRERADDRDLYVIGFPTNLSGSVPVYEGRFATKTYFPGKEQFSYTSTATEWTSHHAMSPCNQWFALSNSVKLDFGMKGSVGVGPTEILTPKGANMEESGYKLMEALAKRGITATPSHDDVKRDYDMQYRRMSFSIGTEGKNRYNETLLARLSPAQKAAYKKELNSKGYAYLFVYDTQLQESWFDLPVLIITGKDKQKAEAAIENLVAQLGKQPIMTFDATVCQTTIPQSVPNHGLALINRGNMPSSVEPDGTMTMALMHTVPWQTPLMDWAHDFPERKTHLFEYALQPFQQTWREANTVRQGYEYNNPLVAINADSHNGSLPSKHAFFTLEGGKNAVITAIKPKSEGVETFQKGVQTDVSNGVVVRYYETEGEENPLTFKSDFPILSASTVNLMERQAQPSAYTAHSATFKTSPQSIDSYLLKMKPSKTVQAPIKTPKAKLPKYYARFWEHNEGAAPTGYLPVSIAILGDIKSFADVAERRYTQQVQVAVTNDYTDAAVKGTVRMETPVGIRCVPETFEYEVGANSEQFYSVTLVIEGSGSEPGFITATATTDDYLIYDAREYLIPQKRFGHKESKDKTIPKLIWNTSHSGNEVTVTVENPFTQRIDGRVDLVGPCELWGMERDNPIAIATLSQRQIDFELEPGTTQTFKVKINSNGRINEEDLHPWLVAKLMYNGYIDYKAAIGNFDIID